MQRNGVPDGQMGMSPETRDVKSSLISRWIDSYMIPTIDRIIQWKKAPSIPVIALALSLAINANLGREHEKLVSDGLLSHVTGELDDVIAFVHREFDAIDRLQEGIKAHMTVSSDTYREFISRINLENFPEVVGVSVFAETDDKHYPIIYAYPVSENSKILKYDNSQDKKRMDAIEHSRATQMPVLSDPVTLLQYSDTKRFPGYVSFLASSHSSKGIGGSAVAFTVEEMVHSLPSDIRSKICFRISDNGSQLFDSCPENPWDQSAPWYISKNLSIGERQLQFEAIPTQALIQRYQYSNIVQNLITYTVPVSFLMASVFFYGFIRIRRQSLFRLSQLIAVSSETGRMALTDELTGLPNYRSIRTWVAEKLSSGNTIGLALLDIDDFSSINDSLGHAMGDELLQIFSEKISPLFYGENAVLSRCGGDEFMIAFLLEDDSPEVLKRTFEHMHELLREKLNVHGHSIVIHASIGFSIASGHTNNGFTGFDMLRQQADAAMYVVKARGGNGYCEFNLGIGEQAQKRQWISEHLPRALENGEFFLAYQPIFDAATGKIESMEALSRWNHGGKNIPPDEFISVAESNGCIIPLGYGVIQNACRQIVAWKKKEMMPPKIFINLSVSQLKDTSFEDTFHQIVDDLGVSSQELGLEVTESMLKDEHVRDVLNRLASAGFELAIDDFGTGYSNIGSMLDMKIGKIKIDKSFVKSRNKKLIEAVVFLARNADARIVVEGVEDQEEIDWLQSLGCSLMQGYYFSKPISTEAVEELLEKNKL